MIWPRIARTLGPYKEAVVWTAMWVTAVTVMVASGSDQAEPMPVTPRPSPPIVAQPLPPPPETTLPPPETRPPPPTTTTPPTTGREAAPLSRPPEPSTTTGAETIPESRGADDQPQAEPPAVPPPPIAPTTMTPTPTTIAPPPPTTTTPAPTTTRAPRNKAVGLPDADDLEICRYEQGKNIIQRPC